MKTYELKQLKERLSIPIPPEYEAFIDGQRKRAIEGDGLLYPSVESVVIANLELRDEDGPAWDRSWPAGYLLIGDDGCGGMYFCDTAKDRVLYWDHETDEFESRGDSSHRISRGVVRPETAPRRRWRSRR